MTPISPLQSQTGARAVAPARFLVAIVVVCIGVLAAHLWNRLRITNGLTRTAYAIPNEDHGTGSEATPPLPPDPGSPNNASEAKTPAEPG